MSRVTEFSFIEMLSRGRQYRDFVDIGIGDDCAVLNLPTQDRRLLVSTDFMMEGVHFESGWCDLETLGRKSVATNVSDIAAMGGEAKALLCSIAVPQRDRENMAMLMRGIDAACRQYGLDVVGGNTSASPQALVISHTIIGEAAPDEIIQRSGSKPGDLIFCTGTVGDAGLGLLLCKDANAFSALSESEREFLQQRFLLPSARVSLGRMLAQERLVHSAIDISDGLFQDLLHLLEKTTLAAQIDLTLLPLSQAFRHSGASVLQAASGGEDYELLFTAEPRQRSAIDALGQRADLPVTCIGSVVKKSPGAPLLQDLQGRALLPPGAVPGFSHF